MGKRRASDKHGPNIHQKTVWHKCASWECRQRQGVALHNPLFSGFLGGNSHGVSLAVLAFWNAVEGAPQSLTIRQLGIGEELCSRLYDRAFAVMGAEALRMQDAIEWGTGSDLTVEVELDCSVFGRWRKVHPEIGKRKFHYYVYLARHQVRHIIN